MSDFAILKKELSLMNESISKLSIELAQNDKQFVRKDEHVILHARLDQMAKHQDMTE